MHLALNQNETLAVTPGYCPVTKILGRAGAAAVMRKWKTFIAQWVIALTST